MRSVQSVPGRGPQLAAGLPQPGLQLFFGLSQHVVALSAGFRENLVLDPFRVALALFHCLRTLATSLGHEVPVLLDQALGLFAIAVRLFDGVPDRLLPRVDGAEERFPGKAPQDPDHDQEGDERPEDRADLRLQQGSAAAL